MRLRDKVAIVFGAGQTPGATIGNGRATAVLFAREGAKVFAVDRDAGAAAETVEQIGGERGAAAAWTADVADEASVEAAIGECVERFGRVDVLHNNVGVSLFQGDAPITSIETAAFDRVLAVNLRGMVLTCKHAIPVMRRRGAGAIVNISSIAVWIPHTSIAYKTSKAAVIALTEQIAIQHARDGIRANVIVPGIMNTPTAVEGLEQATGRPRDEIVAQRDARVPLGGKMGTAWDVAHAALFLASDDARFVTGAVLPVDGGTTLRVG